MRVVTSLTSLLTSTLTSTVRVIQIVSDPRSTQDNVQVSVQLNDAIQTDLSRSEQYATICSQFNWCQVSPLRSEQFAQILPK